MQGLDHQQYHDRRAYEGLRQIGLTSEPLQIQLAQSQSCLETPTVDGTNSASPNIYYTTILPRALVYFGIERHARFSSSTVCSSFMVMACFLENGPQRPHKHKDPTNHAFWYPPYILGIGTRM